TFTADNWPKNGAGIGDGWEVTQASAFDLYPLEVTTETKEDSFLTTWPDGAKVEYHHSFSNSYTSLPPYSISYGDILTHLENKWTYATDGEGNRYIASNSYSVAYSGGLVPLHHVMPRLVAGYTAARQCTELVSFSLFAEIQSVLTDPEDGEALRIDDVRSVNLSETIGEGVGTYVPIGDPRRRSYIAT